MQREERSPLGLDQGLRPGTTWLAHTRKHQEASASCVSPPTMRATPPGGEGGGRAEKAWNEFSSYSLSSPTLPLFIFSSCRAITCLWGKRQERRKEGNEMWIWDVSSIPEKSVQRGGQTSLHLTSRSGNTVRCQRPESERRDLSLPDCWRALSSPSSEPEGDPGQVTTSRGFSYSEAAVRTGSPREGTGRGKCSSGCTPWPWTSRENTRSQGWRGTWEKPEPRAARLWTMPWPGSHAWPLRWHYSVPEGASTLPGPPWRVLVKLRAMLSNSHGPHVQLSTWEVVSPSHSVLECTLGFKTQHEQV